MLSPLLPSFRVLCLTKSLRWRQLANGWTLPIHSTLVLVPNMLRLRETITTHSHSVKRNVLLQNQVQKVTFATKKRKDYHFPVLKEEDLEEDFVRGSGPGGQAVNKTFNCVVLKHLPTGIVVKCHETRSLQENRKKARERMREKIDFFLKGDESFMGQQQLEAVRDKSLKKQKARDRLAMKKAFKEREGLD